MIADLPDRDIYAFDAVAGDVLRVTIAPRAGGTFQASGFIVDGDARVVLRRIRPGDDGIATREFVVARSGRLLLVVQDLRNDDTPHVGGASLTYKARLTHVTRVPTPAALPLEQAPVNISPSGDVALFSFDALIGEDVRAFTTAMRLTQTFEQIPGCSVTIANPTGELGLLSTGDPFAVVQKQGYAGCAGVGGEDADGCQAVSCPPLGIPSCADARPTCSVGNNGTGRAAYDVQCTQ